MTRLRWLALGLTAPFLSSCWLFFPPPVYEPPLTLTLEFPPIPSSATRPQVGLFWVDADLKLYQAASGYVGGYGSAGQTTASLSIARSQNSGYYGGPSDNLNALAGNTKLVTPFVAESACTDPGSLTVSDPGVQTGDLFAVVWNDANSDGVMQNAERLYVSNDRLSYATRAFTYRYSGKVTDNNNCAQPSGTFTESGARAAGWSLVRHLVTEPSDKTFVISKNSVALDSKKTLTLRLHEESNFFSSMSAGGAK